MHTGSSIKTPLTGYYGLVSSEPDPAYRVSI
jgi:hypothetical protein